MMSNRDPGGNAIGSFGRMTPASSTFASMVGFMSGLYSRRHGPSNKRISCETSGARRMASTRHRRRREGVSSASSDCWAARSAPSRCRHEDGREGARLIANDAPPMMRAALHDRVAWADDHGLLIEQQLDVA